MFWGVQIASFTQSKKHFCVRSSITPRDLLKTVQRNNVAKKENFIFMEKLSYPVYQVYF